MDHSFWMGVGAGFIFGWGATSVIALLVMNYNRSREYDRHR